MQKSCLIGDENVLTVDTALVIVAQHWHCESMTCHWVVHTKMGNLMLISPRLKNKNKGCCNVTC